jgi:transcriptional pleiotropic regulator of transition state genes
MKATGIVRKIDELGRIVIPKELCRSFGIEPGTPIDICTEDDTIILRKYSESCSACGQPGELKKFKAVSLCPECLKGLGGKKVANSKA